MKKILVFILVLASILLSFSGCSAFEKKKHEKFYGVVKFLEETNMMVVYIPKLGDVAIPENEGCCSCFDGHESDEDYSYQLKPGDLVAINFKYEKSWDDQGVCVMETYPARFDRKAGHIEALRENISFEKTDSGYILSFPETTEIKDVQTGDNIYFVLHESKNGFDSSILYAEGIVTAKNDSLITVTLTNFHNNNETDFLDNYVNMTAHLTWEN